MNRAPLVHRAVSFATSASTMTPMIGFCRSSAQRFNRRIKSSSSDLI
jgi:hypothetical protein